LKIISAVLFGALSETGYNMEPQRAQKGEGHRAKGLGIKESLHGS